MANPLEVNPDIVGTIVEYVHEASYLFFVPVCKGERAIYSVLYLEPGTQGVRRRPHAEGFPVAVNKSDPTDRSRADGKLTRRRELA